MPLFWKITAKNSAFLGKTAAERRCEKIKSRIREKKIKQNKRQYKRTTLGLAPLAS